MKLGFIFVWNGANACDSSEINMYMEISNNSKHKNFSRQAYSFLKVKLRRLRRKMYEGKYDTRDKNLPTVLANRRNDIEYKEEKHVHSKRHILSLKSKYLEI